MPEISIIIPIYNAKKTLAACLKSIFDQTFKNYEIIAVDDGSTDNSLSILKKYQDRLTIISQANQGAAAARNAGAKIARGQFIIFCDADVIMKPAMLEAMLNAIKKEPQASYVFSSFKFGFKIFKLWPFSKTKLRQMPYIHTTSLIRRTDFPGFDKKLKRFQDWDLWLTMLKQGKVGYFLPQVLFQVKPGGTMSFWLPKSIYHFANLRKVRAYREAQDIIRRKHQL